MHVCAILEFVHVHDQSHIDVPGMHPHSKTIIVFQ